MNKKIPKNVIILGVVSFFNDMASEMIYPIVPLFLTLVLRAPVSIVGLIEGIAEATASIMKFGAGYFSDKVRKRKIFVVFGYGFSAISKLLIGLAHAWPFVLFSRFIDRTGKGLRTSARDSLLLQSATPKNKGFIFGFHRSLDSAGAVFGPLVALFLLDALRENMRMVFFLAFIPAAIGVVLLVFFVTEKKIPQEKIFEKIRFNWSALKPQFKFFFIVSMIFALGNSSDAFLILRSKQLGLSITLTVLAYVLYNIVQTLFSTPAGSLADRIGAKKVFGYGLLIFALVYFSFGFINSSLFIWLLFPIYGLYIAFTDGVSKAYISESITEAESGTYFGIYQMGIALTSFFASLVAGILWTKIHPSATFFYGAFMAFSAFIILSYGKLARKV